MPANPEPVRLSALVRRATELCDPEGGDADVEELFLRFEDADEPVTSVDDVDTRLAEAVGAIAGDTPSPALAMAAAVATYLAFRRDEVTDDREAILRLAARAEFQGHPPADVANWLEDEGIPA